MTKWNFSLSSAENISFPPTRNHLYVGYPSSSSVSQKHILYHSLQIVRQTHSPSWLVWTCSQGSPGRLERRPRYSSSPTTDTSPTGQSSKNQHQVLNRPCSRYCSHRKTWTHLFHFRVNFNRLFLTTVIAPPHIKIHHLQLVYYGDVRSDKE